MTVRWKPLLVLTGLFAVIAVIGFLAMAYALVPGGASDILPSARAERAARKYDKAKIHYQRALQLDGKNPAIHEEMAAMFSEWAGRAPAARKDEILGWRLASLAEAARYGKALKEPRRRLLAAAMEQDDSAESLRWARELVALEPGDADALYVIASEALDDRAPSLPEAKRHLSALEKAGAPRVRIASLKARVAQLAGDAAGREAALAEGRTIALAADAGAVDRSALLRLRALDVETTTDPTRLAARVKALRSEARALAGARAVAPIRIMRLSLLLERVQKSLALVAAKSDPATRRSIDALVDAVENEVESIFRRAMETAGRTDLHIYLTYSDHLRFRGKNVRCLDVVKKALASPLAALATSHEVVLGLHAVAVEAALAETKDPGRFETAAPHIKELIDSPTPRFQGLGHLFQGAIDLERSGVAGAAAVAGGTGSAGGTQAAVHPKLRSSALSHLKVAAALLPDVVEAQARYGVALILSREPNLGRQYLQHAMRLGTAEPQYQIWAAWSIVQAGYPEEAEPIVSHLRAEIAQGRMPRDLEPTLHMLGGEIHQARRSPADQLALAIAEYERSYTGKTPPPAVLLRMAQIDAQLGQSDRALRRIEQLRATGQGGVSAEHLAVLTQLGQGKDGEARRTLANARARYPDSDELAGLEAGLLVKDRKPREADRVLAEYLARHPDDVSVVLMRSQILADLLDDPKEARRLLVNIADRADNSAPLVQLALLDLRQKDYDAVAATIAKVRARWKEAAAADLLDAQLALERGNLPDAAARFDAALKKDPGNKLVQYWKARVDSRTGASGEAARALEALAGEGSSKQLDSGLSLATASKSALANLALQNGDVDGAIRRFEGLRAGVGLDALPRADRWQLVAAYVAKGRWPAARKEIAALLNDPKDPAPLDDRVRAANFYRLQGEEPAAVAQLDYVLGKDPAHPRAVVARAYILSEQKKTPEAIALIRKAIAAASKEKPPVVFFLMLAALENTSPTGAESSQRALAALDQGLAAHPKDFDLARAKSRLLLTTRGAKQAVAFVESMARDDPGGNLARLLAEVYSEQQDYPNAETTLRGLVARNPDDPALAASLVRVMSIRASRAGDQGDRQLERALNDKVGGQIKEFRARFPREIAFLQEECDLAFRRGETARATAVTNEIDAQAKSSPVGPLLRARMLAAQGRDRDAAAAYAEALRRNPVQPDVRLLLGQTGLKLGDADEAIRQARLVLETDRDRLDALLLEARALAQPDGNAGQTVARRARALERLAEALKRQPKAAAIYHQIAEVRVAQGARDEAVKTLKAGLDAVPDDATGLAVLVELLAAPAGPGAGPDPAKLAAAVDLAGSVGARDARGTLSLALAVGFHKAGQLDLALSWAEKAAAKLDAPVVHLNYGDILLSLAERKPAAEAKPYFRRALDQYDLVLKSQANSVEAINNKAWILHTYLGEGLKALELAQGLLGRVDPSTLPGEFFDTLGAIQQSLGKAREAEDSFSRGLRKQPDNPVLNYHMGKLIVADSRRAGRARGYLEKAHAGKGRLTPAMAAEVASLMEKTRGR